MDAKAALTATTLAGLLVKTIFVAWSWLYPEADSLRRSQLDRAIDTLDKLSVHDISRNLFARLHGKLSHLVPKHRFRTLVAVLATCFLLNVTAFVVGITYDVVGGFDEFSDAINSIFDTISTVKLRDAVVTLGVVGVSGTVFDGLSLVATVFMIKRASNSASAGILFGIIVADLLLSLLACLWAYWVFAAALSLFYETLVPYVEYYSAGLTRNYMQKTLAETLRVNPSLWFAIGLLGITAALPSVTYLVLLLPILLVRTIPKIFQTLLGRVLFNITTDDSSVLSLVGNAFSVLAAVIAGIISFY